MLITTCFKTANGSNNVSASTAILGLVKPNKSGDRSWEIVDETGKTVDSYTPPARQKPRLLMPVVETVQRDFRLAA